MLAAKQWLDREIPNCSSHFSLLEKQKGKVGMGKDRGGEKPQSHQQELGVLSRLLEEMASGNCSRVPWLFSLMFPWTFSTACTVKLHPVMSFRCSRVGVLYGRCHLFKHIYTVP